MSKIGLTPALTAALALASFSSLLHAQTASRAWVSGHGTDTTGCGTPAAPCRSLQYAHDHVVAPAGEIDVLDPAGYGSLVITKSISIINDSVGTAGLQQASGGGSAILISAGPTDAVLLRGLDIEGLGTGGSGVRLSSGGPLTIQDCTVKGFASQGILYEPTSFGFLNISNTRIVDIGAGNTQGLYLVPLVASGSGTVQATFERLETVNAGTDAVFLDTRATGAGTKVSVTIADSTIADTLRDGVHTVGATAPLVVMIRNSTISNNQFGLSAEGGSSIFFGRSTLSGNSQAFFSSGGSVLSSYGDNNVDGNGALGATLTGAPFH